jgi:hypothetical protein
VNSITKFSWLAAVLLASAGAKASVNCDRLDGVEYVEIREIDAGYQPWLRTPTGPGRALGASVSGKSLNEYAPVFSLHGAYPIIASFYAEDEGASFTVWFSPSHKVEQPGALMHRAVSQQGPRRLALTYIDRHSADEPVGVDVVYDMSGRKLGERRTHWVDESYARVELSVRGDVLYLRHAPGMASDRFVDLLSPEDFRTIATLRIEDLVIEDVLAIDKDRVFLAAGGSLFFVQAGRFVALGDPSVRMRFERLDYHHGTRRVLAFGPGGYRIYDQNGALLSAVEENVPIDAVGGFADDGNVFENGVAGRFDLRVRDALTGAPLVQLPVGEGPQRTGRHIACLNADRIVVRDRDQPPSARSVPRAPGRP